MQQESDQEKKLEELLSSMRETARENRESLESRYELGRVAEREEAEEQEPVTMPGSGSFYFRTVLCLLIFLGLLFLRRENRSVFGLSPEELQETISSGVLLQETTEGYEKVRKKRMKKQLVLAALAFCLLFSDHSMAAEKEPDGEASPEAPFIM